MMEGAAADAFVIVVSDHHHHYYYSQKNQVRQNQQEGNYKFHHCRHHRRRRQQQQQYHLASSDDDDDDYNSSNNKIDNNIRPYRPLRNRNDEMILEIGSTILTTELSSMSSSMLGMKSLGIDYGLVRTGIALSVGYEPIPLTIVDVSTGSSSSARNSSRSSRRTIKDPRTTTRAVPPQTRTANSSVSSNTTTTNSSSNGIDRNATTTLSLCHTIIHYAQTYQVQQIVVGLPLHKNGTMAEQTIRTLEFVQQLAITVVTQLGPHVPIVLFDERYTSKMAIARENSRRSSSSGSGNRRPQLSASSLYGTLDAVAACIILEHYYDDHGVGAMTVTLPRPIYNECLQQYTRQQQVVESNRTRHYQNELKQREQRIQSMEQAKYFDRMQQQQQQQQQLFSSNGTTIITGDSSSQKKRKKKKRK